MTKQELELCITEYGKAIYSFCLHLTCSRQEADELYQDTFLTALERRETINYADNPKSYLLSIALGLWQNKKRKFAWRKRIADIHPMVEERDTEMIAAEDTLPEDCVISREEVEMVRLAVAKLPRRLKIPILLFYMEELSTSQIATILNIPKGTVLSRLYQARKLLKKELEDVFDERKNR